jgi:hypothetical protein
MKTYCEALVADLDCCDIDGRRDARDCVAEIPFHHDAQIEHQCLKSILQTVVHNRKFQQFLSLPCHEFEVGNGQMKTTLPWLLSLKSDVGASSTLNQ